LNIVKGLSKIYLDLQQLQIENEMNILINNLRLVNLDDITLINYKL